MSQLTPEYMQEWEQRLTSEQINYAMSLACANGWSSVNPPMWVWAQFFREAERKYPGKPKLSIVKKIEEDAR
jgi:hypothetical protein